MKLSLWQISLGLLLVALSAALYFVHFMVFHDAHHIFIYMLGDLAFLPIEVLLVTFILHELLTSREKKARRQKLNMVIGAFFTELGQKLLVIFSDADLKLEEIKKELVIDGKWDNQHFQKVKTRLLGYHYNVDLAKIDLPGLKALLDSKEDFVMRLFENQNLLEHEAFTDLLWATSHVYEELSSRKDLNDLMPADAAHIAGDIKRSYAHLVSMWLEYMKHLKDNYPYLFSLAIRTNPFDETASVEVK